MSSKKNDYIDDEAESSSSFSSFINDGSISVRSWTSDDDENAAFDAVYLSDTSDELKNVYDAVYLTDADEQSSLKAKKVIYKY